MIDVDYKIPRDVKVRMANEALARARMYAPKRTGKGASGLYAIINEDTFGIGIQPWAYYMHYQNDGIKPFIMWNLENKTIPMNIGGQLIFRKAVGVGRHQIMKRDPKTGQVMTGNKPIKWRHPGLKPKHFIERAMDEVTHKYGATLAQHAVQVKLQELVFEAVENVFK